MLACHRGALCKERKGKGENECKWDEGEKVVLRARTGFCRGLGTAGFLPVFRCACYGTEGGCSFRWHGGSSDGKWHALGEKALMVRGRSGSR